MATLRKPPATINRRGATYSRQPNGTYRSDDGVSLDGVIVNAVLNGNASSHGCTVGDSNDLVAGITAGGDGDFGGGGASADYGSSSDGGGGGGD